MDKNGETERGILAVVAMPLGNPGDLTSRAAEELEKADFIAAEDTRTAKRQMKSLGIAAKLVSYHDWNEAARAKWLIEKLREGKRVALISEAGTPGVSDPGFDLVREARRQGFRVVPVPGPSALVAFLSVSGLPTDSFSFFGFPPSKKGKRLEFFVKLADRPETLVFYESPHRIIDALGDALDAFGDRQAALGREMTKTHEEFFYGPLTEIIEALSMADRVRGEVTWGVSGFRGDKEPPAEEDLETALREGLACGKPLKEVSRELSVRLGIPAKEIYSLLVARK